MKALSSSHTATSSGLLPSVAVARRRDGAFAPQQTDRRGGARRLPKTFFLLTLIPLLSLTSSAPARACAACFGDTSGSQQSVAATWGIFAMVVIMFAMLGAVAAFGFYLRYRAMHPLPDYDELLSETTPSSNPGTQS